MGKRTKSRATPLQQQSDKPIETTLIALCQQPDLWYRLQVLLYDLNNLARNPQSERRLASTVHSLYISNPYFSEAESTQILTTIIDESAKNEDTEETGPSDSDEENPQQCTIEEAICSSLANFLDKRKASGDARPCGLHDMIPIYGSVFGITKEDLQDERFLARLSRSGLGDGRPEEEAAMKMGADKGKKKHQRGKA